MMIYKHINQEPNYTGGMYIVCTVHNCGFLLYNCGITMYIVQSVRTVAVFVCTSTTVVYVCASVPCTLGTVHCTVVKSALQQTLGKMQLSH